MTVLSDYNHFGGLHWETGSLHNYFAYRGFRPPHTEAPYSEALLLGVSGGAVFGYFSFAYQGRDPHVALLTRNTFDPFETILHRLGAAQDLRQTASAEKAAANLREALEEGTPAIVWADAFSLPYNHLPDESGMWSVMPLLVYGLDPAQDTAWIADRAGAPLKVSAAQLSVARGRVKKDRYRQVTLGAPDPAKLAGAVRQGLYDCLSIYDGRPPKGSGSSFGLGAYLRWADLLVKPKMRLSWAQVFPPGEALYAGLTSAVDHYAATGALWGVIDRRLFADFLLEARLILGKPDLEEAAGLFRRSSELWERLAEALLPQGAPLLGEAGALLRRRRDLFRQGGMEAHAEIEALDRRLGEMRQHAGQGFPLEGGDLERLHESIRAAVLDLHAVEAGAVEALRAALDG